MSIVYNGAHSIKFTKGNQIRYSWSYLHMVPSSRPYVVPPQPRLIFLNLPRSNNILDLTNSLTDRVTYEPSEGDWEFIIDHDKWDDWTEAFDELSEFFNGDIMEAVLLDQPEYTYVGRIYVSNYRPEADYSRITLHYNFDVLLYGESGPEPDPEPPEPEPDPDPPEPVDPLIVDYDNSVRVSEELVLNPSITVWRSSSIITLTYNSNITNYKITIRLLGSETGWGGFYLVNSYRDSVSGTYSYVELNTKPTSNEREYVATFDKSFLYPHSSFYLAADNRFDIQINVKIEHLQSGSEIII